MQTFWTNYIRTRLLSVITIIVAMLNATIAPSFAQAPDGPPPRLTTPQLERLVAPIALYPDALLTHILMASTYPFEIVQAARWSDSHPGVKGDDVAEAMENQPWDESVKAVVAFPDVIAMMNEKLDWTQELGEAFLAQQDDVFAAVQALRARAQAAGNLNSTKELRISKSTRDDGSAYTEIISSEPDTIYVPVYDPNVVYGTWAYPDDRPYYWRPRHYRDHSGIIWFGAAVVAGTALWAAWDWRRRSIHTNPKRFNSFNRTKLANPAWAFKPGHRKGVPFKAPALTQKFGPIKPATALQRQQLNNRLHSSPLTKVKPVTGHGVNTLKSTTGPAKITPHVTHTAPVVRHTGPVTKTLKPHDTRTNKTVAPTHNKVFTRPVVKPVTKSAPKPVIRSVPKPVIRSAPKPVTRTVVKPVVKKIEKKP